MKKLVLVIICILTLSSGPAYAERSTFMLRAQKVDKTPNFPDKGKVDSYGLHSLQNQDRPRAGNADYTALHTASQRDESTRRGASRSDLSPFLTLKC